MIGGEVEFARRERLGIAPVVGGAQRAGEGKGGAGLGGLIPAGEEAEDERREQDR